MSLVTCKQRTDHFTPMMWFDFIRWRFHVIRRLYQIQSKWCDTKLHFIRNSQLFIIWEIETNICGLHRCLPMEKWEVERFLPVLALMGFLWNKLLSVSRYIMRLFSGWWRLGGNDRQYLAAPIWKCMSGIGDHRFTFFMDLLPNYTFYTNLNNIVHLVVA